MKLFQTRTQTALEQALRVGDFEKFQLALKNGGRVDAPVRRTHYTIFEIACYTKERHQFISACLGKNVYAPDPRLKKNPVTHEYPIHLAALSMDKNNLTALLEGCPDLSTVVEQQYKDRTALFLLFERLNSSNFAKGTECIKVLLDNEANINAYNSNHVTAIEMLLRGNEQWRVNVLKDYLNTGKVILNAALREKIQQTFPDLALPKGDGRRLQVLMLLLEAKTEQEFIANFEREAKNETLKLAETKTLLTAAITHGKEQVVQKLLETETKPEKRNRLLAHSLDVCCQRGKDQIVEWLLGEIPQDQLGAKLINEKPLLSLLTKKINGDTDKGDTDMWGCGFFKCMQTLLEDPRIEVNKTDSQRFTALHYAVKLQLAHVQELLLTKGAYLGGVDLFGRPLICELDHNLLVQQLNRCVTDNGLGPDDQDYKIKLNFRNFQSPTHTDEMLPIVQIAHSSVGMEFVDHPVIASILLIKWLRISVFFYLNLFLCAMFFFSFTAFMVVYYAEEDYNLVSLFSLVPTFVGLAYIIVADIIEFVRNTSDYFKSTTNYIELMLIVSSTMALTLHFTTGDDQIRNIAEVCAIMLSAVQFTALLATIPRLSFCTHMKMLKTVAKNFIQCLCLYSTILVGFAISFYTLYRGPIGNVYTNNRTSNPFNEFGILSIALLKTTVMMTGEYDTADLRLEQAWEHYVLFGLFLFFVPIVLYNLMNGLVVNDAATCQTKKELIIFNQKVAAINKYEGTLKGFKLMRAIWNKCIGGQPDEMMEKIEYIWIRPNNGNTIEVPSITVPKLQEVTVVNSATTATTEDAPATEPIVAAEAEAAENNDLLQQLVDADQEPTLFELPGKLDDTIVTAAKGILCSNRKD